MTVAINPRSSGAQGTGKGELYDIVAALHTDLASVATLLNELKTDFNLLRTAHLNGCFAPAGLDVGTNAQTIKFTTAITYAINGVLYAKAITDNIAMTACAIQATDTYCLYLITIDSGGTVKITKGTAVATDTAVLPARPANEAVVGYMKIVTASAATFTCGTDDLPKANVTATFVNLMFSNSGAEEPTAIAAASYTQSTSLSTR